MAANKINCNCEISNYRENSLQHRIYNNKKIIMKRLFKEKKRKGFKKCETFLNTF